MNSIINNYRLLNRQAQLLNRFGAPGVWQLISPFKKHVIIRYAALLLPLFLQGVTVYGQMVGIGTNTPSKLLSVNGTVVVDHGNANSGSLDSASLLFGTAFAQAGISSNKILGFPNQGGLDFWTNSSKRLTLTFSGNLGINNTNPTRRLQVGGDSYVSGISEVGTKLQVGGTPYNSNYDFQVNGSSYLNGKLNIGVASNNNDALYVQAMGGLAARFSGGNVIATNDLTTWGKQTSGSIETGNILSNGKVAIGGEVDPDYQLRVYAGNARVGGDFHATGFAALGGAVDPNYRLRVYDGNSRFGGNAQVTGNSNLEGNVAVGGDLTIGGKGAVRSNGPSQLRVSFQTLPVNVIVGTGGASKGYIWAPLENISDVNDVRVYVSHFVPTDNSSPYNYHEGILMRPDYVDVVNNEIRIILQNTNSVSSGLKGTLYLMVVYKD